MSASLFSTFPMIDLHTHVETHADRSDIVEIISSPIPLKGTVYSLERHPWNVTDVLTEADQDELKIGLTDPNCLGFGEIGLDKLKGVSFQEQVEILRSILHVAASEQRVVILHCVKAFDEIIQLKKEFPSIPNWAIHGFNKNPELAKQLIHQGFYVSINPQKSAHSDELLKTIPLDRLFLETDNSPFLIEDNYLRAAEILGVELSALKMRIAQNAKHFFEHE